MTTRLVVLLSDKDNLVQALLDAIRRKFLDAQLAAVLVVTEDDAALLKRVKEHKPDFIVKTAGLPQINGNFTRHFPYRVVDVFTAGPGMAPGAEPLKEIQQAFERGEIKRAETIVRLASDRKDSPGAVLDRETIPLYRSDTANLLAARIDQVEQRLLVLALRRLIEGDV